MSFSPLFSSGPAVTATSSSPPPPQPSFPSYLHNLSGLDLGYAIAIALSVIILLSSILLVSYVCFPHNHNSNRRGNSIVLPRSIFVPENEEEESDDDVERNGPRFSDGVVGLEPAAINSYPKFPYSSSKGEDRDNLCPICLCEYKEGEMIRMMPGCKHCFHVMCIDAWLRLNCSCPVCRTSPMPTPLSTPLSELAPLSQFAADRGRRSL